MKVTLPMNGGINKDINPLYVDSAQGEVISRKNCRVYSLDGSRVGINTSFKGMQSVTPAYPVSGTNKVIGYVEDKERDRGIYFLQNSLGNDSIYTISGTTITNLNADSSVLSFKSDEVIDADILGDYCVFTSSCPDEDDSNPPRKIQIWDSVNNTQSTLASKDAYDVQLAVRPPFDKPATQVASDPDLVVNKLVGKTFQFAYMYIYNDYTYSVVSPYSDLVVSSSVFAADDSTYDNNAIGNYVQVTYDLGTSEVNTVKLLAREGNTGSWFVVEDFEKTTDTGTRTYDFYNNVARQALVETEALALYSDVPRLARTVKTVQNRVGLANVLKGYDKTSPSVNYTVAYEDVNVSGTSTDLSSTLASAVSDDNYYIDWTIPVHASIDVNDVFAINIFGVFEETLGGEDIVYFEWRYSFSYTVTQADIDTLDAQNAVANAFAADIVSKEDSIITIVYEGDPFEWGIDGSNEGSGVVRLWFMGVHDDARTEASDFGGTFTQESFPEGVSTFKSGSYYNVGVLFYDDYSRTSGVLSPTRVYIPHAGERAYADAFDRARIAFSIPDGTIGVPSWAKYYRFAVTESVNFSAVFPFVAGNDTDTNIYDDLFIDGKEVIAINLPTNLQYEFAKGDYLHIEVDSGSAITNTIVKNLIGTRTLIDVAGTDVAGFWLIVPKGDETAATYDGELASIYRLKDEVQDLVYFEDSNTYTISSETMQTLTGYVGGEDAWYVQRKFEWKGTPVNEVTPVVEDFYINVDDAIRAYSKGRVVVEFDTLGEIRLQDFVWSFNYLDNTKINGISTFNSLNRKQLDEKDGQIQRLELVGDVIKVVQDNKETSMYVGKAQVSDAAGNLQLVLSNDFIGAINPSENDYGSKHARSIVQYNRNLYYWDGDHGEVVRSAPNGQFPISEYGMKSEFLRIKQAIDAATSSDVFSYYDVRNDEYVITFDIDGVVETWSFKEGADAWNTELELVNSSGVSADFYGNIGEQVYSFGFDKVWKHEATSSYNAFYGDLKQLSIKGVLNVAPEEDKVLLALKTDSNRGVDTNITSPITNTRTVGQKSVLYAETYRSREGSFVSAVFKNILQVGGAENINLIHSGDDLVGKFIEIEFVDDQATEFQLRTTVATYNLKK